MRRINSNFHWYRNLVQSKSFILLRLKLIVFLMDTEIFSSSESTEIELLSSFELLFLDDLDFWYCDLEFEPSSLSIFESWSLDFEPLPLDWEFLLYYTEFDPLSLFEVSQLIVLRDSENDPRRSSQLLIWFVSWSWDCDALPFFWDFLLCDPRFDPLSLFEASLLIVLRDSEIDPRRSS